MVRTDTTKVTNRSLKNRLALKTLTSKYYYFGRLGDLVWTQKLDNIQRKGMHQLTAGVLQGPKPPSAGSKKGS